MIDRATLRRRVKWGAVFLITGGWLMRGIPPLAQWGLPVIALGVAILVWRVVTWWMHRNSSAGTVSKLARRRVRNDGQASWWELFRNHSRRAVARKHRKAGWRPSLQGMSRREFRKVKPNEYAVRLCTSGGMGIWVPTEDVTIRVGGPRVGKSGEIFCHLAYAPGAVIATSTRKEVIEKVAPFRAQRGGPLYVFNPGGVGGYASTIRFNPLHGCKDPRTAFERANDMIGGTGPSAGSASDREFWSEQARRVLSAMLHAAALGETGMTDVQRWASNPDAHQKTVMAYLGKSPASAMKHDYEQFFKLHPSGRTSITMTVMLALSWLNDPASAACADTNGPAFDVAALLESQGTVFMLGSEDGQVAPLLAALTGYVAREARRLAELSAGGRLDPPLTLVLDEAATICPVPLPDWTADMGGRGITIHIAVQSLTQLRETWGEAGGETVWSNCAARLVYGKIGSASDLRDLSMLSGERDEKVETTDAKGNVLSVTPKRVPVMSPADIAQLPAGRVLLLRQGPAAVGKARAYWNDPAIQAPYQRASARAKVVAKRDRLSISAAYRQVMEDLMAATRAGSREAELRRVLAGLAEREAELRAAPDALVEVRRQTVVLEGKLARLEAVEEVVSHD